MEFWLSFHFYPLETLDVFLLRTVRPFLVQHIWSNKTARAFFLRFEDERGPHIRLRLHGEAVWMELMLRPALEEWFAGRGTYVEVPYEPEPERFGGWAMLTPAEEYFHLSSHIVLDRMTNVGRVHGDCLFDALRLHLLSALAAGMQRAAARTYFNDLCTAWLDLFFQPTDGAALDAGAKKSILAHFNQALQRQETELVEAFQELEKAVRTGQLAVHYPHWDNWLRGNERLLAEFDATTRPEVLSSLIHLTNNRLGINNQEEVFVMYILAHTL